MTALRKRTAAERAEIDARAAAWQRPISPTQRQALDKMGNRPLRRTRAGWGWPHGVSFAQTPTVAALIKRGLGRLMDGGRMVVITAAGRKERGKS